jgi:hypothetical protein
MVTGYCEVGRLLGGLASSRGRAWGGGGDRRWAYADEFHDSGRAGRCDQRQGDGRACLLSEERGPTMRCWVSSSEPF